MNIRLAVRHGDDLVAGQLTLDQLPQHRRPPADQRVVPLANPVLKARHQRANLLDDRADLVRGGRRPGGRAHVDDGIADGADPAPLTELGNGDGDEGNDRAEHDEEQEHVAVRVLHTSGEVTQVVDEEQFAEIGTLGIEGEDHDVHCAGAECDDRVLAAPRPGSPAAVDATRELFCRQPQRAVGATDAQGQKPLVARDLREQRPRRAAIPRGGEHRRQAPGKRRRDEAITHLEIAQRPSHRQVLGKLAGGECQPAQYDHQGKDEAKDISHGDTPSARGPGCSSRVPPAITRCGLERRATSAITDDFPPRRRLNLKIGANLGPAPPVRGAGHVARRARAPGAPAAGAAAGTAAGRGEPWIATPLRGSR